MEHVQQKKVLKCHHILGCYSAVNKAEMHKKEIHALNSLMKA